MGGGEALPEPLAAIWLTSLMRATQAERGGEKRGRERETELSADINDSIVCLLLVLFVLVYCEALYKTVCGSVFNFVVASLVCLCALGFSLRKDVHL